jgi:hypothetical protein
MSKSSIPPRRREGRMSVRPLFAWYDLWIGVFWDRKAKRLYVLPLPCIGVVLDFSTTQPPEGKME